MSKPYPTCKECIFLDYDCRNPAKRGICIQTGAVPKWTQKACKLFTEAQK